jgi:hypothetical protein
MIDTDECRYGLIDGADSAVEHPRTVERAHQLANEK